MASSFFYKIEKSKCGLDTLTINNISIHSKFNPNNEADNFIYEGKNLILIFGIGLGYHIKNILKNNSNSIFIIYEPISTILSLYKEKYGDFDILNNSNILILDVIDNNLIYDFLYKHTFYDDKRILYYQNLGYKTLFNDSSLYFYQSIKDIFKILKQNILTDSYFLPVWTKNFFINSTKLEKCKLLNIEKIGKTKLENLAVIASAGPSLNNDLPILREVREKVTIFAVDTAYKTLLKAKVIPDFVVSLDSQFFSLDDFPFIENSEIKENSKTAFIFDLTSYPKVSTLYKNSYFLSTINFFEETIVKDFFNNFKINIEKISTGGTITDYTLDFVLKLGFNNVFFSGLDLSFPNFITHSKNSPFSDKYLSSSCYTDTIDTLMIKNIHDRNLSKVESKTNETLYSDFILQNYGSYIKDYVSFYKDKNIWTTFQNGIHIDGIVSIKLEELIAKLKTNRILSGEIINNNLITNNLISIDEVKIRDYYQNLFSKLYNLSQKLKEWISSLDNIEKEDSIDKNENRLYEEAIKEILLKSDLYFPFLEKFLIISKVNFDNAVKDNKNFYKDVAIYLLQFIYFLIRNLQKLLSHFN